MFSIDSIKSNVKIVRPNLFKVSLTLPSSIFTSTEFTQINKFEFRCEATEIPGRTLATVDDQSTGTTKKFAYDVTYNDINLTVIASEDMNERKLFEKWMDNVVLPSSHNTPRASGGLVNYYESYAAGVVTIYQLKDNGQSVCTYTLHNAYPIQISPMNLSWAEFDTYQRFSVTMTYRYHTMTFP